jgi:hypothetical protein
MSLAAAAGTIGDHLARSLERAVRGGHPFEHWLVEDALPPATCTALVALPPPLFFSPENRRRFPAVDDVASAFQCRATVREFEELCGIDLRGTALRIAYGRSGDEPRGDIGVKRFTMLIHLSEGQVGSGIIFVPAAGDRHGVEHGAIEGAQSSLIVDYVMPSWRARDELAYPDKPVG